MKINIVTTIAIAFIIFACMSDNIYGIEFLTGRGTSIGGTIDLSNPTASELVELPIGRIGDGQWKFESGYHRQFDLSELDVIYFAVAGRWRYVSLSVGISQFGQSDLFTEKTLKTSAAFHYGDFSLGTSLSGIIIDVGVDQGHFRSTAFGFSGIYRFPKMLVAFSVDDINSPTPYEGAKAASPRFSGMAEFTGGKSYSIIARVIAQENESPQLGIGQRIDLSATASFNWGVRSEPLMYGAGIEIDIDRGRLSYGTMVHQVLGLTHSISLSLGFGKSHSNTGDEFD